MNTLTDIELSRLLPVSITTDEKVLAAASSIDPQLREVSLSSREATILARIDELPEKILDILAWEFHADFYDLAYNVQVKRKFIKTAIHQHLRKGTVTAILGALSLIDIQAKFRHWQDFGGEPYTFEISSIVAGDFYRTRGKDRLAFSIRRAVNEAKAQRSLMVKLDIEIPVTETAGLYGATVKSQTIDINLGVEQSLMHELLLIFERRILERLSSCFNQLTDRMSGNEDRIRSYLAEHEAEQSAREARIRVALEEAEARNAAREARLRARIEEYELIMIEHLHRHDDRILSAFEEHRKDTMSQFEELKELLTWNE